MWKRFTKLFVLSAALLLITAACARTPALNSSNAPTEEATAVEEPAATGEAASVEHVESISPSSDADRVVEVEMTEFAIDAASFEFTPGETVEFIVTNSGVVEHEFRLSNQDRVDEHVAGGHADHDEGAMSDDEMAAMDDDEAEHDDSDGHHDDEADHMDDDEAGHMDDDEAEHDDSDGHHDDEADHDEAEAGHDGEAQDVALVLAAGETGTLVFTFPDNDHDYTAAVCLIPGHYEAGMATDLAYGA
jgi:uncharacterized cupredoxin-like copper-binding protein